MPLAHLCNLVEIIIGLVGSIRFFISFSLGSVRLDGWLRVNPCNNAKLLSVALPTSKNTTIQWIHEPHRVKQCKF